MDSTDLPDDVLTGRYLAGELSPAEREAFERAVGGHHTATADVALLRRAWDAGSEPRVDPRRVESLWRRIVVGISADAPPRLPVSPRSAPGRDRGLLRPPADGRSGRRGVWRGVVAAAGVAALALVAIIRWSPIGAAPGRTAGGAVRTYATGIGQRATLTLRDGSRVTLAPQTTLIVPAGFGASTRTLTLRGEAYFDVRHAGGAPFGVRTRTAAARVLGTTFAVRQYAGDAEARVAVVTGKVALAAARRPAVTLVGGTVGYVTDSIRVITTPDDVAPYTAWTDGHLDFRRAEVTDVLATLERWYGVKFRLADPALAHVRVTAALDYSATADLVLVLETLLDVSATSAPTPDGTVITLRPRRTGARSGPPGGRLDTRDALSPSTSGVGR